MTGLEAAFRIRVVKAGQSACSALAHHKIKNMALILGIESSCDETAAAVVRNGEELLSTVVASQFTAHQPYGGVVPELAAREHLRAIGPVVRQALAEARTTLPQIDAIAVTQGPGLTGALLVGITYAKAIGYAAKKPIVAVNHLEGHIHAVLMEERRKRRGKDGLELVFPVLALVVSGGHTHLYLCREVEGVWSYQNIGRTRDDAAGEAFDKVAKLLGFAYPGGPIIDALAKHGDPEGVRFGTVQLKGKQRQRSKKQAARDASLPVFDFSYSGIKTAVLRYTETHQMQSAIAERRRAACTNSTVTSEDLLRMTDQATLDLVASFQRAMVEDLVEKTLAAAAEVSATTLLVTGGVAANSELRATFEREAALDGVRVLFPSRKMSTDNAAMIAAAAYPKFRLRKFAEDEFSAEANLQL
jgi:N6-L-threonylcarbamoyladenine synthase